MPQSILSLAPTISDPPGESFLRRFVPGQITRVRKNKLGQPTFLFDVNAAPYKELTNVRLLNAGFGAVNNPFKSPTGLLFVPEVGSRVLCIHDGLGWVIVGCYAGPAVGANASADDAWLYNPGTEQAVGHMFLEPEHNAPWLFGLEEGDIVLGKDLARVKLGSHGLLLSGNGTTGLIVLKEDGSVLERYNEKEERAVGLWGRHSIHRGATSDIVISLLEGLPFDLLTKRMDGAVYRAYITETTPYEDAKQAYLLEQKGHIWRSVLPKGRSAVLATCGSTEIKDESESKNYGITRTAVIWPKEDQPSSPGVENDSLPTLELEKKAYEVYDKQVDADGSFRERGGNASKKEGAQTPAPTGEMDLSLDYSAADGTYTIRLGKAGANKSVLTFTEKSIDLSSNSISAQAKQSISLQAALNFGVTSSMTSISAVGLASVDATKLTLTGKKSASITTKKLAITGDTTVKGQLNVSKPIHCNAPIFAPKFVQKAHAFVDGETVRAGQAKSDGNQPAAVTDAPAKDSVPALKSAGLSSAPTDATAATNVGGAQSVLANAQGASVLQSFSGMQTMGQQALDVLSKIRVGLSLLQSTGMLGQYGEMASGILNEITGLTKFATQFNSIISSTNLNGLSGQAGTDFFTSMKTSFTSLPGNFTDGITYIQNVLSYVQSAANLAKQAGISLGGASDYLGIASTVTGDIGMVNEIFSKFGTGQELEDTLTAAVKMTGELGELHSLFTGGFAGGVDGVLFTATLAEQLGNAGKLNDPAVTGSIGAQDLAAFMVKIKTFVK